MKKKELIEYQEKYGEIPNNYFDRFTYILKDLRLPIKEMEKIRKGIKKLLNAKWEEIDFVLYMIPKATPRARLSGRTRTFYVKGASDNSKIFKEFIESIEYQLSLITTPTQLLVDMYLPMPSSMNRVEKVLSELKLIRAIVKPDWDNGGKTYSDMIQRHLLLDDSLVCDGHVRKFYSFKPRIEVKIRYMEKYDCKFNKRKIESWKFYKDLEDKIEEKDSLV